MLLQVVSSRLDCVKKVSELSELRITAEEAVKMAETADAERRQIRTCFDQEVHSMRKSYEDKVTNHSAVTITVTSYYSNCSDSPRRHQARIVQSYLLCGIMCTPFNTWFLGPT